ncbi:hypothetical protein D8B46_00320 [Candidatus Gracilibacteria bacterium]|nr:MAG: hypothetical protein D8B46_00320 [Candidatus Gracilibacteria bacterium]
MKKTILGSLVFALFFSFFNVFADDFGTQKCSDYNYPKDLVKSDNFYINQKFCDTKDDILFDLSILDKDYKHINVDKATGKDEYYSALIIGKKDGKKHTKVYLNGKKVLDILSDLQKDETLELIPRSNISTYGNHNITSLGFFKGFYKVSDDDLKKGGLYIDGVKVFGNIGEIAKFLQTEYIDFSLWNVDSIPKKYLNLKLNQSEVEKYSKVINQFNEKKYTKKQKEEIFDLFKKYFKLTEEKMKTGKISDQGYKNFLIYNYIYSEIRISFLKENISK